MAVTSIQKHRRQPSLSMAIWTSGVRLGTGSNNLFFRWVIILQIREQRWWVGWHPWSTTRKVWKALVTSMCSFQRIVHIPAPKLLGTYRKNSSHSRNQFSISIKQLASVAQICRHRYTTCLIAPKPISRIKSKRKSREIWTTSLIKYGSDQVRPSTKCRTQWRAPFFAHPDCKKWPKTAIRREWRSGSKATSEGPSRRTSSFAFTLFTKSISLWNKHFDAPPSIQIRYLT